MTVTPFKNQTSSRGARMLRTALGPGIAAWLEDACVVEVMLTCTVTFATTRLSSANRPARTLSPPASSHPCSTASCQRIAGSLQRAKQDRGRTARNQTHRILWIPIRVKYL